MVSESLLRKELREITGGRCSVEKFKVFIPTCYGDCLDQAERLAAKIADIIGGATIYHADGAWTNPQGGLEKEPVKVLEAYHNCLGMVDTEKIVDAIAEYAERTNQTQVAVADGGLYFGYQAEFVERAKRSSF